MTMIVQFQTHDLKGQNNNTKFLLKIFLRSLGESSLLAPLPPFNLKTKHSLLEKLLLLLFLFFDKGNSSA